MELVRLVIVVALAVLSIGLAFLVEKAAAALKRSERERVALCGERDGLLAFITSIKAVHADTWEDARRAHEADQLALDTAVGEIARLTGEITRLTAELDDLTGRGRAATADAVDDWLDAQTGAEPEPGLDATCIAFNDADTTYTNAPDTGGIRIPKAQWRETYDERDIQAHNETVREIGAMFAHLDATRPDMQAIITSASHTSSEPLTVEEFSERHIKPMRAAIKAEQRAVNAENSAFADTIPDPAQPCTPSAPAESLTPGDGETTGAQEG